MPPTVAEVKLVQLKNCFVNVPQSVAAVLLNAEAIVQNVIIELQYKDLNPGALAAKTNNGVSQHSVYAGWTGMASTAKPASIVERNGRRPREDAGVVEVDATFGRMLGLGDGQKVAVLVHLDPPLAHTVHIEPLTPADWEIIELHASFLESNLLFQVRALPNPLYTTLPSAQAQRAHPLTIHLSPTSTANVIISSLTPPQSSSIPFAKIAPDGEVIVAPKTRPRLSERERRVSRSNASTGRRSAGARSGLAATRQRSHQETIGPSAIFLRGLDGGVCNDLFDGTEDFDANRHTLAIWIDRHVLATKPLKGFDYVCVSIVKPGGLETPFDPPQQQKLKDIEASEAGKPASKVIAKVVAWDEAPDARHAAISSALCSALEVEAMVGGLIRVEIAPQRMSRYELESLKVFPFLSHEEESGGLKLGGHSDANRASAADRVRTLYRSSTQNCPDMLDGPLTSGMILPKPSNGPEATSWRGALIRLRSRPDGKDLKDPGVRWCLGSDLKASLEVQTGIPSPLDLTKAAAPGPDVLRLEPPSLIGVEKLVNQLTSRLVHSSSVLLHGGLGSGKSSLSRLLAHRLRSEYLYHTTYFSCLKLATDETRISTIKDTLSKLFMAASWGSQLGGRAVVILDDLDRLCPVETELQTADNGRSRQVSEVASSLVRQYCGVDSGIVVLATAQAKESLNSIVVGGHVVKEILALKVPDKDGRRCVLQALTGNLKERAVPNGVNGHALGNSGDDEAAWLEGSPSFGSTDTPEHFSVDPNLDYLDLAGQTDGYMPGDLVLLVSRAKNEALIRILESASSLTDDFKVTLTRRDFNRALEGFTPASLRNVTLQSSKTTFDSIGGLHETRKILLETLQYPTTYAPIFANCPLRLRSGLLLYGYPGCGKTLLASAVAGECGLNFISVKGPEILNKYIGASEKSIRDLFERAESAKPCVLFFDEFDSIAPKRGHDSTGVTDRVVNQLLTQMDGAEGLSGVYVLAATSRPDLIDPALLRPGRLDKSLLCDMPSLADRVDILEALSKKLAISQGVLNADNTHRNLREVAHRTAGYSGADLQAVIYNAHLEAIHDVLGDLGTNGQVSGSTRKDHQYPTGPSKHDILQFRFGKETDVDANSSRAKQAAKYAAIIAKLEAVKEAKRKERHARRGNIGQSTRDTTNKDGSTQGSALEVIIEWKHIESSLASTRSSVGADERKRLERIYREFVVGRNGEMPDGQGSTEVGGRSSLM